MHPNAHNDQGRRAEPSKVYYGATKAFHEVIWVGAMNAYLIWKGSENVDYDHEEEGDILKITS